MSTHFIENVDSKERFVANSVKFRLNLNKVKCDQVFLNGPTPASF